MQSLNANAEVLSRFQALQVNIEAGKGLQNVLRSNLGPRGTVCLYLFLLYYVIFIIFIFL